MRILRLILPILIVSTAAAANDTITFNRDIRPILSDKCFACHGPGDSDREAKLRLDIPDGELGALTARGDAFIIKPGAPEDSELWHRVTADDEIDVMPPPDSRKDVLNEEEQDLIRRWIEQGAPYEAFWSFIPPEKNPAAPIQHGAWDESYIDNRVMARLEDEGLEPQPEADKRTLLRRVTFDLTGLPPTLDEIDAFLNDESPDAYETVVNDLLSRPAYGEHMTRYWADLVRLADTNGMHKDFHREFYPYRDWLIRSFNNNLPFDDFIKYQLAGDLYEDPTQDQLVASGFNRLHLIIDKGTALPEESLHKNVLDRVEAFGTAFLGLTVQCAQCHTHKYDPISIKEYYQFYAFFNNFSGEPETTRRPERGLQPPFIYLTNDEQEKKIGAYDADQERLNGIVSAIRAQITGSEKWPDKLAKASVPWIWNQPEPKAGAAEFRKVLRLESAPEQALARFTGMESAAVRINGTLLGRANGLEGGIATDVSDLLLPGDNLITAEANGKAGFAFLLEYTAGGEAKTLSTGPAWQTRAPDAAEWQPSNEIYTPDHENGWTETAQPENISVLAKKIDAIEKEKKAMLDQIPAAMVMDERDPPRQAAILARGSYEAPGEPVERNTPAFLPPLEEKAGPYTRMDLAEWLVRPDHPLTARVAVNRIWQQFFGVGIIKTSEDFGAQGEWPSHPQLLDDLAIRFMESGWDVKALVRDIVLSKTYRQSSNASPAAYKRDPENRLLARGPRYRMDAEMIRDQILAVSDQLNPKMFGPSVKPPQPPGLWEMVSMAEPKTYVADTGEKIYRRSLYTYWRRGIPPPQMTIMNAPSREYCVARRERTNTPLQALLLMNEQEYFKAASACVQSTLKPDDDVDAGLRRIYEKITSHVPDPERLQLMRATLDDFKRIYSEDPALAEALASELGQEIAPEEQIELASWTMLAHSLLNTELAKVKR